MELLYQRLKQIKKINRSVIINSILSDPNFQQWILDLNRLDQLFIDRINSKNVSVETWSGGYSELTEELNQGITFTYKGYSNSKKEGDPMFLYDTGEFYSSFKISLNPNSFTMDANPIRGDQDLFKRFGEDIIGLTPESMIKLQERILPLFVQKLSEEI
jgi:hypothetical protein